MDANARAAEGGGISIHAPHEGERHSAPASRVKPPVFQSTLPTRGSDLRPSMHIAASTYFNPRSPRGGATTKGDTEIAAAAISIHAPHEGERHSAPASRVKPPVFQSTLPTRGSDLRPSMHIAASTYFNPRSPRGGATTKGDTEIAAAAISIHAPHEGERHSAPASRVKPPVFQSTLPTRGSDYPSSSHNA